MVSMEQGQIMIRRNFLSLAAMSSLWTTISHALGHTDFIKNNVVTKNSNNLPEILFNKDGSVANFAELMKLALRIDIKENYIKKFGIYFIII